jgi:serine/threonine protein kinase
VRELAAQLASALDAAAAESLIHLDVKPENVLFAAADQSVHAYVTDFGAGGLAARRLQAPQARAAAATLEYAAPEQLEDAPVDGRTTVYSLGCLLYETLAGATPYVGRSRDSAPAPLPAGPVEADRVFARALAARREERYGTCAELADALCEALQFARPRRSPQPSRRRRSVGLPHLTAAAAALLVLSAGATAASWMREAAPDAPVEIRERAAASPAFLEALAKRARSTSHVGKPVRERPSLRRKAVAPAPAGGTTRPERQRAARVLPPPAATTAAAPAPSTTVASASVVPHASAPPVSRAGAGASPYETRTTAAAPVAAAPPPPPPPPDAAPPLPPPPPP